MSKSEKTVLRQIMDGELAMEQIREDEELRTEIGTELREMVREAVARIRQMDQSRKRAGKRRKTDRKSSAASIPRD